MLNHGRALLELYRNYNMKIKKPTIRSLQRELKSKEIVIHDLIERNKQLGLEINSLRNSLKNRNDDRMLTERRALCSNLGQMIEATSQAVKFIIGKEVL